MFRKMLVLWRLQLMFSAWLIRSGGTDAMVLSHVTYRRFMSRETWMVKHSSGRQQETWIGNAWHEEGEGSNQKMQNIMKYEEKPHDKWSAWYCTASDSHPHASSLSFHALILTAMFSAFLSTFIEITCNVTCVFANTLTVAIHSLNIPANSRNNPRTYSSDKRQW